MTLSNSIFAVSGAATFLDARKDMSNLFACNTSLEPHPGLLTVGGSSAANGNVVVGMSNRMAVTVRPFQAVLNRLGALLIMNDGDVVVSLQAAPSANSRIDVVYVKQRERRAPISDSEDGPIIGVVTGTANLTPVAPQVPDGAVALAQVKVPSGVTNTTASGVVITQVYPFAATRGEELRFRTKGDMDAFAALDGTKAVTLSDNAHYVRSGGEWGLNVPRYVKTTFKRTDGTLNLNNNATTYMNHTISGNTLGATIQGTSQGQGVKLKRGMYLLVVRTQLQTNSADQWMNLGIITSGISVLGPGNAEGSTGNPGYSGIQMTSVIQVNSEDNYVVVTMQVSGNSSMRVPGELLIAELR